MIGSSPKSQLISLWIQQSNLCQPHSQLTTNCCADLHQWAYGCRIVPTDIHYHYMHINHWGRVTQICVGKLTIIGSDNGLLPWRRQAIIWTNAGILLIRPLGRNFSEIWIGIQTFSFKKKYLKMSSAKWRPFCLGLNVLPHLGQVMNRYILRWCHPWFNLWLVTCLALSHYWFTTVRMILLDNIKVVMTIFQKWQGNVVKKYYHLP